MAQASSFINTSRARTTAFLKLMEDILALQLEFNADGGATFTNTFDFNGENASTYDMSQTEYLAMLTTLGEFITVFNGGAVGVNANRQRDLYKGKV